MSGHIWKTSQVNLAGLYLNDRWEGALKYIHLEGDITQDIHV